MRFEASATSISWIPSEAITGSFKVPFSAGIAHYDEAPPEVLDDLVALRDADRFRFANEVRAWIEVFPDAATGRPKVVNAGHAGAGHIGSTTLRLGSRSMTFMAVPFETLRSVEHGDGWVRFTQTAGGRAGVPAPRPVKHPPYFRWSPPTAWTTLSLTIHTDGRHEFSVDGASPFPRHWIYDHEGKLAAKSGLIDFKDWSKHAFGKRTPWGDEDAPALVTAVESALERELSTVIMRSGSKPEVRKVKKGATLVEQGDAGEELFLLLDGVLTVEVNGENLAELGPGAILGERALLEGGTRTSTLRAVTACKVAVASGADVDREALEALAQGHRREESS